MINFLFLIFPLTAISYYPLFNEEFENPKAFVFLSFCSFAIFFVNWSKLFKDKISFSLFLFSISCLISSIFSIDKHMSLYGNIRCPNGFFITASYLVLYLSIKQNIKTKQQIDSLIKLIIFCSFLVSSYALSQALGYDFQGWSGVLTDYGFTRPISTLGHPNFMAAYLSMVFPFTLDFFNNEKIIYKKVLYLACILLSITAIFLSLSRGMLIAFFCGFIFYFALKKQNKYISYTIFVSLLVFVSAITFSPTFKKASINRYSHLINPGFAREEYPKAAIRIWRRYPFLGVGSDAFEIGFQHQRTPKYWQLERAGSPHRAHNDFLNILATQGILGALCALFVTMSAIFYALRSKSVYIIPASSSILMFYIQGLTSFYIIPTGVLFILCLALINFQE